ncbi:MAG: response regulator [Thermodesulfobacteriota bacterium]
MERTLLLVDEDSSFLDVLTRRLKAAGFTVHAVSDLSEALQCVLERQFALAILGCSAQSKGSLMLLEQIRVADATLKVIVLSTETSLGAGIQAMKLGAYDCLQKPINMSELLERIEDAGR